MAQNDNITATKIAKEVEDLGHQAGPRPLTAQEIIAHPEYKHVVWDLKPTQSGKAEVAKTRGGPFNISYEIHGHGPRRIVWIMGLGGLKTSWQRQTKDFGHLEKDKYSCLVLDNRGVGSSDKPVTRYSTSEMAQDVVELLDHVGWTEERSVNVVGISMGGMISQELAVKIPTRIQSISFISTGPRIYNTVGFFENLYNRAMLLIPRKVDAQLAGIKYNLFSDGYLHLPDELEYIEKPYPTNGDRCMAIELRKRLNKEEFPKLGFVLQLIASGWHHKSQEQLKELAKNVGHERIQVVHGTSDRMVTFPHGEELFRGLGGEEAGITKRWIEGQGHVLPIELREEFKSWIDEIINKTEKL